ncbi:M50 family metallopeptidase [Leptolyngbya sp. AN02str]|uniref:M50 family metallopeptidase n=1 Tax=Leptolyngbya sp. AN02str TaxID=3423363 RepID=UPI003D30FD4E
MSKLWDDNDLGLPPNDAEQIGLRWLVAAAIATILLWQIPLGDYILYPFSILATWFHEMGHGITALVLGGNFHQLQIFPNGSGFATHSGVRFLGPIGRALVAMGGPMGPPMAGAAFILASRHRRSARWSLIFLGLFLLISTLIWVRSLFGFVAIPALGVAILWIGTSASRWLQCFGIQFLGLQACISTYHQLDYLFMGQAFIGGQLVVSDSGQIAQNLLLPYWFWGGFMAIASALLLYWSLRLAYTD